MNLSPAKGDVCVCVRAKQFKAHYVNADYKHETQSGVSECWNKHSWLEPTLDLEITKRNLVSAQEAQMFYQLVNKGFIHKLKALKHVFRPP